MDENRRFARIGLVFTRKLNDSPTMMWTAKLTHPRFPKTVAALVAFVFISSSCNAQSVVKPTETFLLIATAWPCGYSEVSWSVGAASYSIISNIDFRALPPVISIDTPTVSYGALIVATAIAPDAVAQLQETGAVNGNGYPVNWPATLPKPALPAQYVDSGGGSSAGPAYAIATAVHTDCDRLSTKSNGASRYPQRFKLPSIFDAAGQMQSAGQASALIEQWAIKQAPRTMDIFVVRKTSNGPALDDLGGFAIPHFAFVSHDSGAGVFAHECGHGENLATENFDNGGHDNGPWPIEFHTDGMRENGAFGGPPLPPWQTGLMYPSVAGNPWIRQPDWITVNNSVANER